MKLRVVAVGHRMPGWVDEAFQDYAKRMPRTARVELIEIRPEPRDQGKPASAMMQAEARRIEAALPTASSIVALDERGRDYTTVQFAKWLGRRIEEDTDTTFVIGGPDGLAPAIKARAEMPLRLSSLTLPHGLARVLLAEQLYRAASILQNHPYHRE